VIVKRGHTKRKAPLKGPIKAKEPTTVKGPTERKLKFFSYFRMAVDII